MIYNISIAKSRGPSSPTTEYAYQYDDIGNRITSFDLGTNCTYTANNLNQYASISNSAASALSAGEFIPQFDDDGNQTRIKTATGIWSVTYNGENCPVLWECVSTNSPTPNSSTPTLISMSYDRMGRRVAKNNRRFVYDGYLQIANSELQTPNSKPQTFIWDPTESVATRPLVWRNGDVVTFYTHDGNKNVSEVIKFNGITGAHYEYAPFGVVAKQYGDCAVVNPWRFSSECADVLLGMMYFNYRCYGYFTGRWFSRDPVEELGILLPVDYDVDMKEETLKYEMLILQYIKIADRFGDQDGLHKAIEAYSLNRQRQDVQNVDMSKKLQPCYLYIFNRPCGMFDDRGLKTVVVGSSIAVGCALADGPFPIGDIVAIGIIACCVMNNPPEIPRCPPPPSPPPPEVHSVSNQHGCPLAHWHYFVYHQAPWPLCINRLKRNFGGCIPPKPGQMPPPNE